MSFSVSDGRGSFEYSSSSLNGVFANRRHVLSSSFTRMLAEVPRFQRAALALLRDGDERVSLRAWLQAHRFSSQFVERLVVPQAAAVWSADPGQMWSFPALFLARFFENHGMLDLRGRPRWRTISGGSARYVDALTAGFTDRVRLRSPVRSIARDGDGVEVTVGGAEPLRFDHVVIATHSDQALAMLADAILARARDPRGDSVPAERGGPAYGSAVLPSAPARLGELELPPARAAGRSTVTYHLNRLQRLSRQQFCVTLNLPERIDPEQVIKSIAYAHPVYTAGESRRSGAYARSPAPAGRTHFCGAYWGWGFHEDGVTSALRVAETFGARL